MPPSFALGCGTCMHAPAKPKRCGTGRGALAIQRHARLVAYLVEANSPDFKPSSPRREATVNEEQKMERVGTF